VPKTVTILRVFIASPRDVAEERKALESIITELNLMWKTKEIRLELIMWETHAAPGFSSDAQAVINEQIADDYDIFVGVLWTRFGTPTPRADSGTEEEFERAYARWKQTPDAARLMLYFKNAPIPPDEIDLEQLKRVRDFRKGIEGKGGLYRQYTNTEEFRHLLRLHINEQVDQWGKSWGTSKPAVIRVSDEFTVKESAEVSMMTVEEDEEGLLDVLERFENDFGRLGEVVAEIGKATAELGEKTKERTKELESVQGDPGSKRAAFKRSINRSAEDMSYFVSRMKPANQLIAEHLSNGLDAYGRVASLLLDFGRNEQTLAQLRQMRESANKLKESIVYNLKSIGELRNAIANIPRATTQLNRAKRESLHVLDSYTATTGPAINLITEIEQSLDRFLNPPDHTASAGQFSPD